ncbi:MAG: 16S rRNA (cytosine1402-N4)-methyltransferase [Flavobacteriaceae bacterium]|jgi:16S rRNA (cytosine1402-N4)-methyltransferase
MKTTPYHSPVMLQETVAGLAIDPLGVYVDVTFGGGGHSAEILRQLGPDGKLFAFDQDKDALANSLSDTRFTLINENFRFIKQFLRFYGVKQVNGILADFGVSSHQFDEGARGFSTRFDGDLDMRMNQSAALSAKDVVATYTQEALSDIFFQYGDLRNSKAIAAAVIAYREATPITTTTQLKESLSGILQGFNDHKLLAQIYQAIRIEVNQEIQVIKELLEQTPDLLLPGGRLSVLSYHSLEDRLVKRFIRAGQFEGEPEKDVFGRFEVPLKKVGGLQVPSKEELKLNTRSRSAKLRVAEKPIKKIKQK